MHSLAHSVIRAKKNTRRILQVNRAKRIAILRIHFGAILLKSTTKASLVRLKIMSILFLVKL